MAGKVRVSSLVQGGPVCLERGKEKTMSFCPALIGGDAVSPDAGARVLEAEPPHRKDGPVGRCSFISSTGI